MNHLRLKSTLFVVALMSVQLLLAQDYDLDKVSEEELEMEVYAKDSLAPAVYLNKIRETYVDYKSTSGFMFVNEVTERIKILSKEGLDYATKQILSYKSNGDKERVEDIEAVTYNLVDGKIEKTKIDKEGVFENERSEHWDETTFTMPDVQVGSVVEWSYKTVSPYYKIDDLVLQESIPVVNYYAKIRTPGMFQFRRIRKGYFDIKPKESVADGGFSFQNSYGTSTYASFKELVAEYTYTDIPAIKEEVYLVNPRNYRWSVVYELISTEINEGEKKEYATTWEEVAKSIFKAKEFGGQMNPSSSIKKVAESIVANNSGTKERIDAALKYVKSKVTWNENYGKFTEDGVNKAYDKGSGDVAEINLLLTVLLRECGVQANPVLISTKQYGIPLYPTREGYNYVVVGIRNGLKTTLLDATDKLSAPNILPTRVYNWKGRMINAAGVSQELDLLETISPRRDSYISAELTEDGKLTGVLKQRFSSLEALELRHQIGNKSLVDWKNERVDYFGVDQITNHKMESLELLDKPITESLDFVIDQAVDQVPGQMYLNPLVFLRLDENPFKADERLTPVEFDYPVSQNINITIKLPQGYTVQQLPEASRIVLPGDMGSFTYSINNSGNTLQVMTKFDLKDNFIPVDSYLDLKEFFKMRITKEAEKVILQKSI